MKTATVKLYMFSELSAEVKSKVIGRNRDYNLDFDWWDHVYEDFISVAKCFGFEVESEAIQFSGFGSQGDGASFTCTANVKDWKTAHKNAKQLRAYAPSDTRLLSIHKRYQATIKSLFSGKPAGEETVVLTRARNDVHKYSVSAGLEDDTDSTPPGLDSVVLCEARDLMEWLYRQLESEYDHLTSDTTISEMLADDDKPQYSESGHLIGQYAEVESESEEVPV